MRLAAIILAALVIAGAGFAGGWFTRKATREQRCYVEPAYTNPDANPLLNEPRVVPPNLVCK
jgi:hypothetical protein